MRSATAEQHIALACLSTWGEIARRCVRASTNETRKKLTCCAVQTRPLAQASMMTTSQALGAKLIAAPRTQPARARVAVVCNASADIRRAVRCCTQQRRCAALTEDAAGTLFSLRLQRPGYAPLSARLSPPVCRAGCVTRLVLLALFVRCVRSLRRRNDASDAAGRHEAQRRRAAHLRGAWQPAVESCPRGSGQIDQSLPEVPRHAARASVCSARSRVWCRPATWTSTESRAATRPRALRSRS